MSPAFKSILPPSVLALTVGTVYIIHVVKPVIVWLAILSLHTKTLEKSDESVMNVPQRRTAGCERTWSGWHRGARACRMWHPWARGVCDHHGAHAPGRWRNLWARKMWKNFKLKKEQNQGPIMYNETMSSFSWSKNSLSEQTSQTWKWHQNFLYQYQASFTFIYT